MNKIHFLVLPLALFCLAIPALPASADHGGVGFGYWVTFDEQAQNAIVAWNGDEEVLILSTEVGSAASGKLLEFLPLPSRPRSMTGGDYDCFRRITSYFDSNTNGDWGAGGIDSDGLYDYYYTGIQVLERANVGPHDITVVKITSTEHFNSWVRAFAKDRDLPAPDIPERLGSCVGSYVGRNICYFAFDVIDIGIYPVRVDPVVYRFDTPYLFYPLEVTRDTLSNAWWGHTISVFLVTGEKLKANDGKFLSVGNLHGRSLDKRTSSDRLYRISEDLGKLFPEGAYLSHVMLTLKTPFDLNRLSDIVISFLDFEDPIGYLMDRQVSKVERQFSWLTGPLKGPSVFTILWNVPPEDLAGQLTILVIIMIFITFVLGHLLFRLFRHLGPGLNWKRLLSETYSLAYMMSVFGLIVPYPVLKVCMAIIAAFGLYFLVAIPVRRRFRARRFERELKEMLKQPN
jgi:hypothetical protein